MPEHNLKFRLSLDSMTIVGESTNESNVNDSSNPLVQKIADAISKSLFHRSTSWIDDFRRALENMEIDAATRLYNENKVSLIFLTDKSAVTTLRDSPYFILDSGIKKELLLTIIGLCGKLSIIDRLEIDIDTYIEEYGDEADQDLLTNLTLEKANTAARDGRYNSARITYAEIIRSKDCKEGIKAWAYQGLSKIATSTEDKYYYSEEAADRHLIAGNRLEAIKNFISMAESKKNIQEALDLIDSAIKLNDLSDVFDKEIAASLYHTKAVKLLSVGRLTEALESAIASCDLRRTLIIDKRIMYSSLQMARYIAGRIGNIDAERSFKEEVDSLAATIDDDEFHIQTELQEVIQRKEPLAKDLEERALSTQAPQFLFSVYLYKAISSELALAEKMDLLDKARKAAENTGNKQNLAIAHFAIAEEYRKQGIIIPALENYRKSLENNPFYYDSAQNCASMLMDSDRHAETERFINERIQIVGKLPNISYAYAKSLMKLGRYSEALEYLEIASSVRDVKDLIIECALNGASLDIHKQIEPTPAISLSDFRRSLNAFSKSVSSDSRMQFWQRDEKGAFKWASHPEALAKHLLITFLNGYFKHGAIEIIQETRAGAGFIDLYVLLRGGLKVVIELKMCGGGYSSGYAISGGDQIIHYLDNRDSKVGFLVVFDGRIRDYNKGFSEILNIDGKIIYTTAIDLRTEF